MKCVCMRLKEKRSCGKGKKSGTEKKRGPRVGYAKLMGRRVKKRERKRMGMKSTRSANNWETQTSFNSVFGENPEEKAEKAEEEDGREWMGMDGREWDA